MTRADRDAWVKALRSGEFQQGRSRLATKGQQGWHYCCLGVYCEVKKLESSELEDDTFERPVKAYGNAHERHYLPTELAGDVPRGVVDKLADMNDGGLTFSEIANYIERNVPVEG